MDDSEIPEFVCDLEGTEVTLDPPSEPPSLLPRQTWVIENKLNERVHTMTQQDVTNVEGLTLPYATAKFVCHRKSENNKKALMRVYLQIPTIDTLFRSPQIRRRQADGMRPHDELTALKALKKSECGVVPDLLAYQEARQDENGLVPGGYVVYVVWEKVPGEPLIRDEFWKLDLETRNEIRKVFRETFPKLLKCGYIPLMPTMKKIIYDKATKKMWFSGFSFAGDVDPSEEWHDKYYVMYRLAKPSLNPDWINNPVEWTW